MIRGSDRLFGSWPFCLVGIVLLSLGLISRDTRGSDAQPIAQDFASLLQQFRSGDADAAVATFAAWPTALVERETADVGELAESDPWQLAARILLHTEAGRYRGDFASGVSGRVWFNSLDQIISLEEYEVHYRRAATLIEPLLLRAAKDDRLAVFARNWHILATPNGGGFATDVATLPGPMAPKRFPLDASSWLLYGSVIEPGVTHQFAGQGFAYHSGFIGRRSLQAYVDGRNPDTFTRNSQGDIIDLAQVQLVEHAFRRALELNPDEVEARLRLGRVLWRANRPDEAESEFLRVTQKSAGADRLFSGYLAWLWLGQMKETERLWEQAAQSYEQAALLRPDARSARMALAALRARIGASGAAFSAAESLLRPAAMNPGADPLTLYPHAQSWRHDRVKSEMRQLVRSR